MSVQNTKSTESFIKHNQKLEDQLTAGGFTIVTKEEAVQILFDNGLIRPDRADAGNVIQNQFKYVSPTGDIVWIHTGIIGNSFSKKFTSFSENKRQMYKTYNIKSNQKLQILLMNRYILSLAKVLK